MAQDSPLWFEDVVSEPRPKLARALETDVAVVGAGITGLTAALLLRRAGHRVVVLEAEGVGAGATGATSAHLSYVPDLRLVKLIEHLGLENAALFVAASRSALRTIFSLARKSALDCELTSVAAYLYTETKDDVAELAAEAAAARTLGIAAELVARAPLAFPVQAAVVFPAQARFHPLRYLEGLAAQLVAEGGEIYAGTRVIAWKESDGLVLLECEAGSVSAGRAIFATHTPLGLNLLHAEVAPYRSYLLAMPIESEALSDALFWDTASPYHYLRRVTRAGQPLLLVGGEDHKTGQEQDPLACYERLEDYARARLPVRAPLYRWSSQYYEPADGLPYIGRSPFTDKVLVATGYSGTGLVLGTLAARLLHALVCGDGTDVARLLEPERVTLAAVAKLVAENANVAARFIGDRVVTWEASVEDLPRGEGRLVDVTGEKLAVYRDAHGALSACSPVCTHMGCIVQWNAAERSWDCPCHGGRFSPEGRVVNGPPVRDLPLRALQEEPAVVRKR